MRDREKEGVCVSVNERDSVWQRERMCERGCMCVWESRYEYERLCVRDRVYKRKKGVCVCAREYVCEFV